jgi:hypothetical protein
VCFLLEVRKNVLKAMDIEVTHPADLAFPYEIGLAATSGDFVLFLVAVRLLS